MINNILDIVAIETDNGFLVSANAVSDSYSSGSRLENLLLNGEEGRPSFLKNWLVVGEPITSVQRKQPSKKVNLRYELIDPSLTSDKVPEFVSLSNTEYLQYTRDALYDKGWKPEFQHLSSLYKLRWDEEVQPNEDIPFNFQVVLKVNCINEHQPFAYKVQKTQFVSDGFTNITPKSLKHNLIDRIMLPAPVLPDRPCELSSEATYKIIRQHVKDNLNPMAAEITSDYDFCFTVKKKIRLAEPEKFTVDVNNSIFNKRKRKPKYEDRYRKTRLVKVFEMTHARANHKDYTPVQGFKGESQTDIKEKIDFYLESLMEFLNTPLTDCPHCKGHGVILDSQTEEDRRSSKVE